MEHEHTNALINESSPYLLQHAHNPVDWHPWSNEALELAEKEDKLLLVSVGYSACHWCHVMEHETFEDSTVAAYMNQHFISIKVDREERPDVDQVYMDAVQIMTQSGGWPLNCFALADGKPIYGGTYFQKDAWMEVLKSLVDLKTNKPESLREYADQLTQQMQKMDTLLIQPSASEVIDTRAWEEMVDNWKPYWDTLKGGPNRSPKFPLPNNFQFLQHHGHLNQDSSTLNYVNTTLNAMIQGGIYDQIEGGWARYSVDENWKVPHFEKMLYDNAQMLSLYAQAYKQRANPEYERILKQTAEFMTQRWEDESGGYYSAYDADSEGEEGKFYVWTQEELSALDKKTQDWIKANYEINEAGVWEGKYILLRGSSDSLLAQSMGMELNAYYDELNEVHSKLVKIRNEKEFPGLDDKVLTAWNGLLIKGFVDTGTALEEELWIEEATSIANFIWSEQVKDGGKLNRNFKDGKSSINGYLEDYAFVIDGYLSLYQATLDETWLERATQLLKYTEEHFSDERDVLFYFTSDLDPALITRKIETQDNVIPSANSQMAKNLFLLGTLYDNNEWKSRAEKMVLSVQENIDYGQNYSNWAQLALWMEGPFHEIAITGPQSIAIARKMQTHYLPSAIVLGGTEGTLPLLEGKFFEGTTIFVCQNKTCQLPVTEINDALDQIHLP
ncbi:MAG: thioredoxin domain-containing protein [Bacteroidota bacterium]